MPRRPPGASRARQRRTPRGGAPRRFSELPGLGGPARAAVHRLEAERFWPGCLQDSLARFARPLRAPGRVLYPHVANCPCDDALDGRDTVEALLRALAPRPRREVRALVARLDEEFAGRTLPDPGAPLEPGAGWWNRRLSEP
ncbi:hypothetical protein [Streptomyces sedi]|uniref:Uncharacterized protein n=1 Tax=Streptomyces sedi TaxID=555059 RepID=A0A5C4V112_9ACTN|nr:hypothetical protein [Streptomyces sedi]TNM28799.1 hypothetical protein FH715_17360 [Streptomyces sedi]